MRHINRKAILLFSRGMIKLFFIIIIASVGMAVQAQSWLGGTLTYTTNGPIDDGVGGTYTTYTNWVYTDTQGVAHPFSIETEKDHIYLGDGKYRNIYSSAEGVSSDQQYALRATGSIGNIGIQVAVRPKYRVLSIMYAPPGAQSFVSYQNGSTLGTSTAVNNSFSNSTGLSVDYGASAGITGGGSLSANWTKTKLNSIEESTNKTESLTLKVNGPVNSSEGINHDYDIIILSLNPQVNTRSYSSTQSTWDMGNDPRDPDSMGGADMDLIYVPVLWLKHPEQLPASYANRLQRSWAGPGGALDGSDYTAILASDPFANGSTTIDTNRFLPIAGQNFPYTPASIGGQPITASYSWVKNNFINTTASATDQFSVSSSSSYGISFIVNASIKSTSSWTWTNTNTYSNTSNNNQQSIASITGPDSNYSGPTSVHLYWDSVYNAFFFSFGQ